MKKPTENWLSSFDQILIWAVAHSVIPVSMTIIIFESPYPVYDLLHKMFWLQVWNIKKKINTLNSAEGVRSLWKDHLKIEASLYIKNTRIHEIQIN